MITDHETNKLYLSDCFQKRVYDKYYTPETQKGFNAFFERFHDILIQHGIDPDFLPGTKDIWARDYMPIQVSQDRFVEFRYDPDYLQGKKYRPLKTYPDYVCDLIGRKTKKTDIVLDGGNVIKGKNRVIMCSKIYNENPRYKQVELLSKLKELFEIEEIIIIPTYPDDLLGHADGLIRLVNDQIYLINDYDLNEESAKTKNFIVNFEAEINRKFGGTEHVHRIPYYPYDNLKADGKPDMDSAIGLYINYLQIETKVFVPQFKELEKQDSEVDLNQKAILKFKEAFPDEHTVIPVYCDEIAREGGVLNCISWNIKG
jgi:agmatine deiminase